MEICTKARYQYLGKKYDEKCIIEEKAAVLTMYLCSSPEEGNKETNSLTEQCAAKEGMGGL